MKHTLLFTTMANHRPVIYSNMESSGGRSTDASFRNLEEPRQFHVTQARDPNDTNHQNPQNPPHRTLSELLARSTQPIFSVSAMFHMKAGGGCGSCGH
jgi:hypothetical protein